MSNNYEQKIVEFLLSSENLYRQLFPIETLLQPVKENVYNTLNELKYNTENSNDLSDKIFYINKYIDILYNINNLFDNQTKRLQQTLLAISKISSNDELKNNENKESSKERENKSLTPEQCNEILAILRKND